MWTLIQHSIEFRALSPGIEYADIRTDINFHSILRLFFSLRKYVMIIWAEMSMKDQGRGQYFSALIYFCSVERPGEGYLCHTPELPYVFNFALRHVAVFTV